MRSAHRNYCNFVKGQLLHDAVSQLENDSIQLLDLCCGRGGDLHKWNSLKLSKVYGVDCDKDSINEAIKRYREYRRKVLNGGKSPMSVQFYTISAMSFEYIRDNILRGKKVNIVSCMFALHYFCETDDTLRFFLSNVSNHLMDGGVFVGIAPDSEYIVRLLDPNDPYKIDEVRTRYGDSPNSYYFAIKDDSTNTDYFSFRGESLEYLVNKEILVSIALEFSLELVDMKNITLQCEAERQTSPISELYFSFIFRRVLKK